MRADCINEHDDGGEMWTSERFSPAGRAWFSLTVTDPDTSAEGAAQMLLDASQVRQLRDRCQAFLDEHGSNGFDNPEQGKRRNRVWLFLVGFIGMEILFYVLARLTS